MTYEEIISKGKSVRETSHNKGSTSISNINLINDFNDVYDYDVFRALCVATCYTSVYKGMNASTNENCIFLWDTLGRLLFEIPSIYIKEDLGVPNNIKDIKLRKLFISTIKLATREWNIYQDKHYSDWGYFTKPNGFPVEEFNPSIFYIFPLLETVAKRALREYFDSDFNIVKKFKSISGQYRGVGTYCSSVVDVLNLFKNQENKAILNNDLDLIYEHITFIYDKPHFEVISKEWRNPTLHGSDFLPTSYIILLNICLLIAIDDCKEKLIPKFNRI